MLIKINPEEAISAMRQLALGWFSSIRIYIQKERGERKNGSPKKKRKKERNWGTWMAQSLRVYLWLRS